MASNEPTKDFFRVSHQIVSSKEFISLPSEAQQIYLHLCRLRNTARNNGKDYFTASRSKLIAATGLKRVKLERNLAALKTANFIRIQKHQGSKARFRIFEYEDDTRLWGETIKPG